MSEALFDKRLVPVAVIERKEDAVPLAKALIAGGLNVIEVTLRTPVAMDAMRAIKAEVPEMQVGAGTVIDPAVVPELKELGCSFVVSPGLNPEVVKACQDNGLMITPGVVTPGEVEKGLSLGLKVLKFFPAEAVGGVKMLKALAGPYGHTGVKFIPTGGINAEKAKDYWALPIVAAVGGSWFVDKALVNAGKFDEITRLTQEALKVAEG